MIFVDSSGEYLAQTERRTSDESEDSYAEILSSDDSSDSYYSDGGELAEYWDPYCECSIRTVAQTYIRPLDLVVDEALELRSFVDIGVTLGHRGTCDLPHLLCSIVKPTPY